MPTLSWSDPLTTLQASLRVSNQQRIRPYPHHSAGTPLALIGPAHFSISLGMYFARYSGLLRSGAGMVTPTVSRRARTDVRSSVSLAALARRRTIASGVPLG